MANQDKSIALKGPTFFTCNCYRGNQYLNNSLGAESLILIKAVDLIL